ncbi:MAG: cell division protein FtsL [Paraclostridium sp.]
MNRRKKFLAQYIVVGMFICATCVSLFMGFVDQVIRVNKYNNEITQLNTQIKSVEKEINDLKDEKKNLSEDEYIQDIARNRLKMVKPNEIIYIDINKGSN